MLGIWDDPTHFIVVPAVYSVRLGLGLPADLTALALLNSGWRLGQVLRLPAQPGLSPRVLHAHAAAMAHLLASWARPTGPSWRPPATQLWLPATSPRTRRRP